VKKVFLKKIFKSFKIFYFFQNFVLKIFTALRINR
jgi:hypothetical protein